MNLEKLTEHIKIYLSRKPPGSIDFDSDLLDRKKRVEYYRSYTSERILAMSEAEFAEYISKLWAMRIWGNKMYVIEKLIKENGFKNLLKNLDNLLYGKQCIEHRWDDFRKNVKGMGPAMMSELLCLTHPDKYLIWNRPAKIGLSYLGVKGLPKYDYQCNGKKYQMICAIGETIRDAMINNGYTHADYLLVDYFIWDELQIEISLLDVRATNNATDNDDNLLQKTDEVKFIHNEVRDKLAEIGEMLGFSTNTEVKIANGSQVDTIWEMRIGNMGLVVYAFEVQTHGSIDSLIVNLTKALNNPAVQGVVAVSDKKQLEKIKRHAEDLKGLMHSGKFIVWDFHEVLKVHESLENAFSLINKLGLAPQGLLGD